MLILSYSQTWYEPTYQDYSLKLVRVINQLYDEDVDVLDQLLNDTEALQAGASALLYGLPKSNAEAFKHFVLYLRNCASFENSHSARSMQMCSTTRKFPRLWNLSELAVEFRHIWRAENQVVVNGEGFERSVQ